MGKIYYYVEEKGVYMAGLIGIFIFAALIAAPVFYIAIRKLFPRQSKRLCAFYTTCLTALTLLGLAYALM